MYREFSGKEKQPLPVKLSEFIRQMNDETADYSIAFNDSASYRRQWQEIPACVKERLHMSVILADKKGNIVRILKDIRTMPDVFVVMEKRRQTGSF